MSKFTGRNIKLLLIVAAVLVVLITGGAAVYLSGIGAVDSDDQETVNVTIPSGSGASAIIEILDENGLIKNKTCAKIHARIGGYDTLQANSYVFSRSMTLPEMLDAINTGDMQYIYKNEISIIAGNTIYETAAQLEEKLPYSYDEIINAWADQTYLKTLIDKYWFITDDILDPEILYPLEGYFYPDTYYATDDDSTIQDITEMFLDRMDEVITPMKSDIEKSGFTVHEFLTLTSIVTAEGGDLEKDLPLIAGVFINRLNSDMSLGSDVTVNYIYQQKVVNINQSQLDSDSKYNTRKYAGLPPSPICFVLDSRMEAVLNYEETDYLFFYGCPDGTVLFAETLEEHNKNAEENPWPSGQ